MKVVTFAQSKGGAGKTTLVHNVSVYAASVNRGVLLADLDPQQSLAKLWDLRGELINPRLVKNVTKVAQSVSLLESAGYDKEFMLVDTPGSFIPVMRDAIEAADVVVLPTRPNPVDLKAAADAIALVEQAGKMPVTVFVLTQTEKGELLETAKKFLAVYQRPVITMPKRVEYPRSQDTGRAGCENSKDCRTDIRKVWDAITDITTTAHTGAREHSNVAATRH
jgi:chromosome partitioning protein